MKTVYSFFITCALLLTGSMIAAAQSPFDEFDDSAQQKNHFKPIPISPEKSARISVSQMDSVLNLSEKQQTKLYKMLLKWAREDSQYTMPNMGAGFGGGMPPGGMGGGMGMPPGGGMGGGMGMPPGGGMGGGMGMPPQGSGQGRRGEMNIEEQQKQMEKKINQREKKIKKALTDEQYDLWVSEGRPGFPAMKPIEPRRNDMDWEEFINSVE